MFSIGASKIANSAKENVSRYGNIAGQKVIITYSVLLSFPNFSCVFQSVTTFNQRQKQCMFSTKFIEN